MGGASRPSRLLQTSEQQNNLQVIARFPADFNPVGVPEVSTFPGKAVLEGFPDCQQAQCEKGSADVNHQLVNC